MGSRAAITWLIEALERAEGPSRELDAAIAKAIDRTYAYPHLVPRYTESIDAARTLEPHDCLSWMLSDTPGGPSAQIILTDQSEYFGAPKPGHGTPAIALCIAALKAREQEQADE